MTTSTQHTMPDLSAEITAGPQWLAEKRNLQRLGFNQTPLPRRGLNLWRYTDPSKFVIDVVSASPVSMSSNLAEVEAILFKQLQENHLSALVIDRGGRTVTVHLSDQIAKAGAVILPLSQAVQSHPQLVEPYLYQLINNQTGKFEALNGALWRDGVFVHVPDGKTISAPIHLVREASNGASRQFPRLLVVIGRNSEATMIDEYSGGSPDSSAGLSTSHGAVEIFGLADSRVRYLCLQRQAAGMNSYLTHRAQIDRGAQMVTMPLVLGGNLSKQNFGVILNGKGADSRIFGLAFGTEYQQFDNHTLHHHLADATTSNIDFKVVLRDKATSAYTGLIRIDHAAKGCQAYQENRNLLLTPGTRAETVPELEILNEDVSCTHGATVGPIDPMQIFYLQCRGIEHRTAERMIVAGFLEKTLRLMPEDLYERVAALVHHRLEAM